MAGGGRSHDRRCCHPSQHPDTTTVGTGEGFTCVSQLVFGGEATQLGFILGEGGGVMKGQRTDPLVQ